MISFKEVVCLQNALKKKLFLQKIHIMIILKKIPIFPSYCNLIIVDRFSDFTARHIIS